MYNRASLANYLRSQNEIINNQQEINPSIPIEEE